MRRPVSLALGAAMLVGATVAMLAPSAGAGQLKPAQTSTFNALTYRQQHGYLPLRGVRTLQLAKAHAAAMAGVSQHRGPAATDETGATDPRIGAKWEGVYYAAVSPSDSNGAIGPNSYIEIVNVQIGIYKRDGTKLLSAPLSSLTGHGGATDPMVLWDPHTQRFYYNVLNVGNARMDWGFSKDSNPTSVPGSFCNYETDFGYPSNSVPDYPKLGQTRDFLTVGINYYPAPFFDHATEADLLWMGKPQGKDPITRCPGASTIKTGTFLDLRNEDDSQAFTPVPAIQTDPSHEGFVTAMSDIECPPTCGHGTILTLWTVRRDKNDPTVPALSDPRTVKVGRYESPPDAPQKGTDNLLDTLDGRLTHAVSGVDPRLGRVAVWISHTVLGGAGSDIHWYEVRPGATPKLIQSGVVKDPDLWVFNGGISTDRTVNAAGRAAHGKTMVLGFNTSSTNAFPAIQMVSKIGGNAQSGFVLVQQATQFHNDFSCTPVCRWGDYSGATPDPAAAIKEQYGEVWLTCQSTVGTHWTTWNWEAKP